MKLFRALGRRQKELKQKKMKSGNENKRRERNKKEKQGMKKRFVDFLKEISEGPKKGV